METQNKDLMRYMDKRHCDQAQEYTERVLGVLGKNRDPKGGPTGARLRNASQGSNGMDLEQFGDTFMNRPIASANMSMKHTLSPVQVRQSISPKSDARLNSMLQSKEQDDRRMHDKLPQLMDELYGRPQARPVTNSNTQMLREANFILQKMESLHDKEPRQPRYQPR